MVKFIVIWMLAGGALQGSPWQTFKDIESCEAHRETVKKSQLAREILYIACVDKSLERMPFFEATYGRTK